MWFIDHEDQKEYSTDTNSNLLYEYIYRGVNHCNVLTLEISKYAFLKATQDYFANKCTMYDLGEIAFYIVGQTTAQNQDIEDRSFLRILLETSDWGVYYQRKTDAGEKQCEDSLAEFKTELLLYYLKNRHLLQ
jgi:hypothetical protein